MTCASTAGFVDIATENVNVTPCDMHIDNLAQEAEKGANAAGGFRAGQQVLELLARDIKPRDIVSRKAFQNAIRVIIALAGSTNGVLHLLAMAHAVEVKLTLDGFIQVGKTTPVLADLVRAASA